MSDVRKTTAAVEKMAAYWPMLDALLEGTRAMRAAGESLLPRWPSEELKAYEARIATATLFPGFARTVEILAAKPFSKPLTLSDDVPARVKELCDDVDLQGRNLHVFSATVCDQAVSHGLAGILVDYPLAAGVRTQADEKASGVRPYMVLIKCTQLLGWRAEVIDGRWKLLQLRFVEHVVEQDGEFGETTIEQVRVLDPGAWRTFRKQRVEGQAAETWVLHKQGITTLDVIPFVPVYGKRTGFMTAIPPLLELAYMNVKHWQSQSDQDTIEHFARVPILAVIGGDEEKKISVGGSSAVNIPLGGDMKFVEHGGKAIEAGAKALMRLEDQMRQAGAELLVIKPGNTSESQTLADNEQGKCALQRIAEDLEDALDQALYLMARWIGEKSGGSVKLFNDFGALTLAEASGDLLLKSAQAGMISDETFRSELKRRGTLSPDVNEDEEKRRLDEQPPPLGTVLPEPGSGDDE